jgi:hypothetical protein
MTHLITAFTLVDITDTGTVRVRDSNTREYHQQQNLNVLLQTIGLRAQPFNPVVTIHQDQPLAAMHFGKFYTDATATVWSLKFYIEHDMAWSDGEDQLAFLKSDANGVAITSDLDNTLEFPVNIFDTLDNVNLYFVMS